MLYSLARKEARLSLLVRMVGQRATLVPLAAALLALSGCDALDDRWERTLGTIDPSGRGPMSPLIAPAHVKAGAEFTVIVATVGSSTCTRADGAEVRVIGLFAEIVPYDRRAPAGTACTDDLASNPHEVRLRFAKPGEATIRVVGRPRRAEGMVQFELPVSVIP